MPSVKTEIAGGGGITGAVDISDRCSRLLGELCFAGSPIDPRAIRALTFLTDSVDVSGSLVTIAPGSLTTMEDAFMELRLMADALKDIPLTIDPSTSNVRVITQTGSIITTVTTVSTVTNLPQIGGVVTNGFIFDTMDIVFNTGIRPQIV